MIWALPVLRLDSEMTARRPTTSQRRLIHHQLDSLGFPVGRKGSNSRDRSSQSLDAAVSTQAMKMFYLRPNIPRKPNIHLQVVLPANKPPKTGPNSGPSCGPSKNIDMENARFLGSVTSATVPAPREATLHDPNAWMILRATSAPYFAGTVARAIFATMKIANETI